MGVIMTTTTSSPLLRLHAALVEASNAIDDMTSDDVPRRRSLSVELRTVDKAVDDLLRWTQGQFDDAQREREGA